MSIPKGPLSTTVAEMGIDDGMDVDLNTSMVTPLDKLSANAPPTSATASVPLGALAEPLPPFDPAAAGSMKQPNRTILGIPPVAAPPARDFSQDASGAPAVDGNPATGWTAPVAIPRHTPATPLAAALPEPPGTVPPPPTPPGPEEAARWQETIASYEREAKALTGDKRAAPLFFEIGRIYEERLLAPRQAASAYQVSFKTDPAFVPVIHAARRLFTDINNWPMVVTLLDSELAVEKRPRQRGALLVEKGRIQESKLNKPDDALGSYRAAFEADPAFLPSLDALVRLLRTRNAHEEISDLLTRTVAALPPGVSKAERGLELARLYEGPLQNAEKAAAAYTEVLLSDPGCTLALHALERLYARLGRYEELLNVLTRLWESAPNPEETASVPLAVARIARYSLGDDARALAVLEKARQRTPKDAAILRALAEVYASAGRHQDHVEVLLALAAIAKDDKQRAALHFEAGNILEDKLKDEATAIAQYKAVLGINARMLPALQALGRLYQRNSRFDELASMYEQEIAALDESFQKVPRLLKLAELRVTALGDEEGAANCYKQILTIHPGYVPALKALASLYVEHGKHEELIGLHEEELKEVRDRDQTIFLLNTIANLWEGKLGRLDQAIETYQRILKVAPNHLPALHSLSALFERTERWAELVRINAIEAEMTQDQQQVVALLHRNGEILEEKLSDKDGAINAYKKVLALSPNYLPTLKSLGRLYSMAGAFNELIAMYRQEAEVARQQDHRVDLLYKIGVLYEEKLKDPGKAVGAYKDVLKEKPDHHPAVRALMRMYLQQEDFSGVVEMAQKEATLFSDPLEQAHALYRAGEILAARLGRPQEAAAMYQRALQLHPTFDAALNSLVELASITGDMKAEQEALRRALDAIPAGPRWVPVARNLAELLGERMNEAEAAAKLYDQILELAPDDLLSLRSALNLALRRKDWQRSIALATTLASKEPEAEAAAALYLQVASWRQHHIEPPQDPIPAYLKALEYTPNDPVAMRAVERAYRRTQSWEALYQLYDRERPSLTEAAQQLDICMRMADIATFYLMNDEFAIAALEKASHVDGSYMPALRRLGPLYDKLGRHSEKLQLLALEAESTKDPARAFNTLLEVAQLQETKFNNIDAAVDCYFKVLERDPRHAQSLAKLDQLLTAHKKWDKLVELLGRKAAFSQDNAEKADLMMRAAQLMIEHLGKKDDAVGILHSVLRLVPTHAPALQTLADLHDAAGRPAEAAQAYTMLLQLLTDANAATAVNRRVAQLFRQLGDPARAAQHYGAALAVRPSDMALAGELTELYLSQRAWQQAAEMLAAMGERDPSTEGRVTHFGKLAKVMEEGFQDQRRALECYKKVLELKPDEHEAVTRLVDLAEQLGDWGTLTQAYQSMIANTARTDRPRLAALHMRMALLYLQRLNMPDKGLVELRHVVECDPDNMDARGMLGAMYARNPGTYTMAMDEHRRVVSHEPWRMDSYHDLGRIYDAMRQRDRQFLCAEILHHFKQCNEGEEFFFGDNKAKVRAETDMSLSEADHEGLLVHPKERGPVREIIRKLAPELHKVFPVDLASQYNVGKAERLAFKSQESVRKLLDNMVRTLGGKPEAYDLYVSKVKTMELAFVSWDPPSLVVGADVVKRHQTREQRFLIGQRVMGMMSGHQVLEGMSPERLQAFLIAACMAVDDAFPATPDAETTELHTKIKKAISRGTRKALAEPVAEIAKMKTRFDGAAFLRACRLSRLRAGVALSNDVEVSVRLLAREMGISYNPQDMADVEKKFSRDEFRELFAFIISDDYATLRNRLRFAVDA